MDRKLVQRSADVHRSVHRLCWRIAWSSPGSLDRSELFHAAVPAATSDPQLHAVPDGVGSCRAAFRNVLSTNADLRAPKYSRAIPSVYSGTVRNVRRRSRQHCAFSLWLVSRSTFVPLDVLEFSSAHARLARMHLLRDSRGTGNQEDACGAKLHWISLCECRIRDAICSTRPGPEAGLVALRSLQCPFLGCIDFIGWGARSAAAQAKSVSLIVP